MSNEEHSQASCDKGLAYDRGQRHGSTETKNGVHRPRDEGWYPKTVTPFDGENGPSSQTHHNWNREKRNRRESGVQRKTQGSFLNLSDQRVRTSKPKAKCEAPQERESNREDIRRHPCREGNAFDEIDANQKYIHPIGFGWCDLQTRKEFGNGHCAAEAQNQVQDQKHIFRQFHSIFSSWV